MFISDNFIYTELHKTAGTHIGKWLQIISSGTQVGKHNMIPQNYHDRFIFGSIRNPWDWYVSLWAYGCDLKGSVKFQTSNKVNLKYYLQQLPNEMGLNYITPHVFYRQFLSDLKKPVSLWQQAYSDSSNPQCFQLWLKLLFSESRKFDLREGYGFSPISDAAGLLTYRFMKLFTKLGPGLYSKSLFLNEKNIKTIWDNHKLTDFFIRMEHLEDDLILAMNLAKVELTRSFVVDLHRARDKKTNTSSRMSTKFYYDEESIQLVYNKDRLIIDLFEYSSPNI